MGNLIVRLSDAAAEHVRRLAHIGPDVPERQEVLNALGEAQTEDDQAESTAESASSSGAADTSA